MACNWPHMPTACGCPAEFAPQLRAAFATTDPADFGAKPTVVIRVK